MTDRKTGQPKEPAICWTCWQTAQDEERKRMEAEAIMADLDTWAADRLLIAGLSRREVKADLARVPLVIKKALPKDTVRILLEGKTPSQGFGLGGNTDGGKTMAVAAILKGHLQAWAKETIPARGKVEPAWMLWTSWPDEVAWLRSHAIDPAAPARVEDLARVPLLILDDLGRERIKGSYSEDWAASQLDAIVNARYREERVTIWTTNVTEGDQVNLYGAAMLRRLTADNPLVWIADLRSAR